jgi:hypothetical protein
MGEEQPGQVPRHLSKLVLQKPPPGIFDVNDLKWTEVKHVHVSAGALIPSERIKDFIEGESRRGQTEVLYQDNHGGTASNAITDKRASCVYGKQRKKGAQLKAAGDIAAAKNCKRRSAVTMHESIKKGCNYSFYAKEYEANRGCMYITFPFDASMGKWKCEHYDKSGTNIHKGCLDHIQHTQLVKDKVLSMLRLRAGIAVVTSGVQLFLSVAPVQVCSSQSICEPRN